MAKTQSELAQGDWLVHCLYGLGQIVAVDSKEMFGDTKQYYVVKTEQITYWLPVDEIDPERIRPVASKKAFKEALEVLAQEPQKLDDNFRRRLIHIKNLINDGSLQSKAVLIRDITARDLQKDLHINEKKILENLQRQFMNELKEAEGIDEREAQKRIKEALKESCANLKPKKPIF